MALTLSSSVVRSEGLRHIVQLSVVGPGDELRMIRAVEYDLGPSFDERYRRVTLPDDASKGRPSEPFAIDVAAYGDFVAVARLVLEGGRTEVLTQDCFVPPTAGSVFSTATLAATADSTLRLSPASPQAGMVAQLVLAGSALVMAGVLVIAWPDASNAVRFLGWEVPMSSETRFLLLAAAAAGLGALVQSALSLTEYLGNRTVYPSWIWWFVLRAPTGILLGVAVYVLLVGLMLPTGGASMLSPTAVSVLSFLVGLSTSQITTRITDIADDLFQSESSESGFGDPIPDEQSKSRRPNNDVELAKKTLRGQEVPAQQMYELAERLRKANEFGYARRLYGRLRQTGDWAHLKPTAVKVGQRHALATYKDPDLPAADRFKRALEILDEVDQLDFGAPAASAPTSGGERSERRAMEQRQESFGLRGAVHKRRWQIEGQRVDLERALGFYLRGYQAGAAFPGNSPALETDQGYNGINAAFVLDLLAREDAKEASYAGVTSAAAMQRFTEARAIREHLIRTLPELPKRPDFAWLSQEWWFHATLAEAYFGTGRFDDAIAALRAYNTARGLSHQGPPIDDVQCGDRNGPLASWEFESTLTQLTSLALLHVALTELLRVQAPPASLSDSPATTFVDRGRQALREYLDGFAPALERAEIGKLGLALSGGGFRASLFHVGVLAHLAERDVLRRVEVLSCVSGGSIVGAHYYLLVKRLLETTPDADITREHYIEIVEQLARDFLAGVQSNIRTQVFGSMWANLRTVLQPNYTTTRRLGVLYERELFARVRDGAQDKRRVLSELFVCPKDETAFKPKYDNWRRLAKVPILVLNATTLNTGHNWQFTASWMGEPPISLDAEIEGNYRLRRMYYWEAPRLKNRWRHWYARPFAPPDYQHIRLGEAVAASSCVPGLFEPIAFPDLFDGKVIRLVDGGVHDNQGIASLIEQDCAAMIVSDASGQMETQDDPKPGRLGVSLRSYNVSMTRVRQAQYRELASRQRSGLLRELMFLHLKRDLDADPVDWRDCQDPLDASDEARPATRRGVLTQYGIHKDVQRLLSGIRTDLDSFTDLEAFALMTSGYRQAEKQFACLSALAEAPASPRDWHFLAVQPLLDPGPSFEEAKRQLKIGARTALKVWLLSPVLQAFGLGLIAAGAFGVFRLWQAYRFTSLITVDALGRILLALGAMLIAPKVVALLRYHQTIRSLGWKSAAATLLALLFKVHLLVFDPIFLKLGRLKRFHITRR